MNAQEREVFWKTLCSLQGNDFEKDSEILRSTIMFPRFLYRYRPVSISSLDALRTNRLYFSSANYYDDPFDTFLHIDIEAIKSEFLSAFETEESTAAVIDGVKDILSEAVTEEQLAQLNVQDLIPSVSNGVLEHFLIRALSLRGELKKDAWSVCFSESGLNENLWLKYAQQHKGFVLIYDLENTNNLLCGKQEKCQNCGTHTLGTHLYPIYYSDTPYDATNFAKILMMNKLEEAVGKSFPANLKNVYGSSMWEREKVTLIKKKCHEYDEEWRMITSGQMNTPLREWIPSGIILGLRMDEKEEALTISIAQEAGIKTIYKAIIDIHNKLDVVSMY